MKTTALQHYGTMARRIKEESKKNSKIRKISGATYISDVVFEKSKDRKKRRKKRNHKNNNILKKEFSKVKRKYNQIKQSFNTKS